MDTEIETDLTIRLSPLPFDEKGEVFPKKLKDLWDGDFVFLRQRLCQREFEDILDAGTVFPIVYKAVVVLKTTIDAAVELDDLVCIQGSPQSFRCRFSLPCTEAALLDWASSNPAFTLDSLAACSLVPGAGASAGFFTSCYCPPVPFGQR